MTPAWLKVLHLVVITLWGDDRIDVEIITRELRAVLPLKGIRKAITVVCELDDEVGGRWRRRLWVGR